MEVQNSEGSLSLKGQKKQLRFQEQELRNGSPRYSNYARSHDVDLLLS